MKKNILRIVWTFFALWTMCSVLIIGYTVVMCIKSPYTSDFLDAIVFFILFVLGVYFFMAKNILLRIAQSVERIDGDLYRVHTLLTSYEFRKKDVVVDRNGNLKIDVYSGKVRLSPNEYDDSTSKKNFLKELLSK